MTAQQGELPKLYTPEEVASLLRISRRTVYRWLAAGKLKAVKIGKGWRVSQETMEELFGRGIAEE